MDESRIIASLEAIGLHKNEILIKQGTPLAQYVPFRKENFDIKLVKNNKKYQLAEDKYIFATNSKFKGGYYHHLRD